MERAIAEQGELQRGSNMGAGQVKAADYFLAAGHRQRQQEFGRRRRRRGGRRRSLGHFGGWGGAVGALAGGINVKKGEANVTLAWSTRARPKRKR